MPKDDRRAYIKAMLCLMDLEPHLTQFPGVTNRYEDFVAVHINQSDYIHGTGNFLSWHRFYLWAMEEALRNECGYSGTQPVRDSAGGVLKTSWALTLITVLGLGKILKRFRTFVRV